MSLSLVLNGQLRVFSDLSPSATVDELIAGLGLAADRVAVEHNDEIVSRSSWAGTVLQEGDRLEVVQFVGGGSGAEAGVTRVWSSDSQRLP